MDTIGSTGSPYGKKNVLSHSDKLKATFQGPYRVVRVHTNGTLTIRLNANSVERINIRRLKPYKGDPPLPVA